MTSPLIPLVLGLATATSALAADLHIDPVNGVDAAGGGSVTAPFKTIGFASSQAVAGDVLHLRAGSYGVASGETLPIDLRPGTTIQGAGSGTTIITGSGAAIGAEVLLFADAAPGQGPLVLRDLTLEQGGGRFPETGMLVSHAVDMERCALEGGLAGLVYEPWEDLASDDLRIVDCTFSDQGEVAVEALLAPHASLPANVVITGNTVLGGAIAVELTELFPTTIANGTVTISNNTLTGGASIHCGHAWLNDSPLARSGDWTFADNDLGTNSMEGLGFGYEAHAGAGDVDLLVAMTGNVSNGVFVGGGIECGGASGTGDSNVFLYADGNEFSGTEAGLEVGFVNPDDPVFGLHEFEVIGNRVEGGLVGGLIAFEQLTAAAGNLEKWITVRDNVFSGTMQGAAVLAATVPGGEMFVEMDLGTLGWLGGNSFSATGIGGHALVVSAEGDPWPTGFDAISARGNRWGTTDLATIEALVFHGPDEPGVATVDFSNPLTQDLQFTVNPTNAVAGDEITVSAAAGTVFSLRAGLDTIGMTVGGLDVTDVDLGAGGASLTGTIPAGLATGSTVDVVITNPDGTTGTSSLTLGGGGGGGGGGGNQPPVANDDLGAVDAGQSVIIDLLANDQAFNGAGLDGGSVVVIDAPRSGQLSVDAAGVATYAADAAAATGDVQFTYTVADTLGQVSNVATVTVQVTAAGGGGGGGGNQAPQANPDSGAVDAGQSASIDLLANDVAFGGATLDGTTVALAGNPTQGVVSVDAEGVLVYVADAGATNTTDVFTYTVKDSDGLTSNVSTVVVHVHGGNNGGGGNQQPLAVADSGQVDAGHDVELDLLANDQAFGGATLDEDSVVLTGQASQGTVAVDHGVLTFTADAAAVDGSEVFTYTVADSNGLVSNTATVTITVLGANGGGGGNGGGNQPPIASDDNLSVALGNTASVDLLANDVALGGATLDDSTVVVLTTPDHGSVSVDGGVVTFTSDDHDPVGLETLTYTVDDSNGLTSNIATLYIQVQDNGGGNGGGNGGRGPMANYDQAQVSIGGSVDIDVLANDDAGANPLDEDSVTIMQTPQHGSVSVDSDGVVTYDADPAWLNGTDVFTYMVADTAGNWSNVATVQVDLAGGGNQGPHAVFDLAEVDPGTSVEIHVLDNDVHPNGHELDYDSIVIHQQPSHGTITVDSGRVTYTPNAGVTRTSDAFAYSVTDEYGMTSNIATCQVNVTDNKR